MRPDDDVSTLVVVYATPDRDRARGGAGARGDPFAIDHRHGQLEADLRALQRRAPGLMLTKITSSVIAVQLNTCKHVYVIRIRTGLVRDHRSYTFALWAEDWLNRWSEIEVKAAEQ